MSGNSQEKNATRVNNSNQKGGKALNEVTEHEIGTGDRSWAEMVRKGVESGNMPIDKMVGPNGFDQEIVEPLLNTTAEGVQITGYKPIIKSGSKSWADVLDEDYNRGESLVDEDIKPTEALSDGEDARLLRAVHDAFCLIETETNSL
ncbi:hypothetical protein V6N13_010021 [Hibiscus sabdariffa]